MADEASVSKSPKTVNKATRVAMPRGGMVGKQVSGFSDFLREYGVVALAVGFVFGAQVKTVVDQFTTSFVNPILGLVLPGTGGLAQKNLVVHVNNKTTLFAWGALVSSLISFIIIAAIIYYTVKVLKLDKLTKK